MTLALGALVLAVAQASAAPVIVVDGDVGDAAAVRAVVESALVRIEAQTRAAAGAVPLAHRLRTVRVRRAFALAAHTAAASTPGVIEVRAPVTLDARTRAALAHEAAHQVLWSACPASSTDALFHEVFAVWASGESALWLDDDAYLSLPQARDLLEKHPLDSRDARRALARVVAEERAAPSAVVRRLRACADGAPHARLALEELAAHATDDVDVLVVVQRATGEVVQARGDVLRPLPFGSTLKPFVVAAARMAARPAPTLPVRSTDAMWACPLRDDERALGVERALLSSCNGYFLDWAARDPDLARLGDLGPLLVGLGLSELPSDMRQAIGVQATLRIPARGLALAYRALSWARPDVIAVLQRNADEGTLGGRAELVGVAAKTGTVRGLGSAPDLGLLVAVTDDVVVVRARAGVTPQALVDDVAGVLRALPRAARTVTVQTFGLLPPDDVRAACDGGGVGVGARGVERVGAVAGSLAAWARRGAALCAGPWRVSFADDARARPYLGTFTWSPPPDDAGAPDPRATPRQRRARRGSDLLFATSLGRYVQGVLRAEDSGVQGAARTALARVIAHNALHAHERHGGRPPCDTTHCQTFLGTTDDAAAAHELAPLSGRAFLPFSQGGSAPWRERRTAAEWRAALQQRAHVDGRDPRVVRVANGAVVLLVRSLAGDGDDVLELPCEPLRNALRLPSCPSSIEVRGTTVLFAGAGHGHGLGLDVERAKAAAAAGAAADVILREAYGAAVVR